MAFANPMDTSNSGSKPFLDFSTPRAPFDTSITDLVRIEVSRYGSTSPNKDFLLNNFKEFTDCELKSVWVNGLKQSWELVDLASQYKTNAGIRLLNYLSFYQISSSFKLGYSRFVYRLKQPQSLAALVEDPFFYHVREFAADTAS